MIQERIFRLPPVGRIGRRRVDRLFMEQVEDRAARIRKACCAPGKDAGGESGDRRQMRMF